jgi:hypothetical protein
MFAPMIVLALLKPEDGAMVSVLLMILLIGVILPQVLIVTGKREAQI